MAEAGAAMGASELEERLALYEEYIDRLEKLIPAGEEVAGASGGGIGRGAGRRGWK